MTSCMTHHHRRTPPTSTNAQASRHCTSIDACDGMVAPLTSYFKTRARRSSLPRRPCRTSFGTRSRSWEGRSIHRTWGAWYYLRLLTQPADNQQQKGDQAHVSTEEIYSQPTTTHVSTEEVCRQPTTTRSDTCIGEEVCKQSVDIDGIVTRISTA